jgi:hypothetical protein
MGYGHFAGTSVRYRLGGMLLAVLTVAVLVLPMALSTAVARADVPFPDDDSFYSAPPDLAVRPDGAVLGVRPVSVFGLPIQVSAWQLRYRTTDSADLPILDVATVIVPPTPWPGARPLLSYQVPEDSLGTRCAPSFALAGGRDIGVVNTLLDVPFMTAELRRGWALVVSDYEGPRSRFFDGVGAGRAVLDGVRAARTFAPGGVSTASPVGAWGYSGGAFATLWAAQLRSSYAPDVRLAGISTGGVPAGIPAIARRVDGGLQAGLALVDRYCDEGATLTAIHSPLPTHNGAAIGEAAGGMNFVADRLAGRPVRPGCTIR